MDVKALYSEVHEPPRTQVDNLPGKDIYSEVNEHPQNQPNSDAYAEVVPNANLPAQKVGSPLEIVYSTPQFGEDPKSTPLYTNYEVANRVNDTGMVPTLRGQTHSIFPMSYSSDHVDDDDDS